MTEAGKALETYIGDLLAVPPAVAMRCHLFEAGGVAIAVPVESLAGGPPLAAWPSLSVPAPEAPAWLSGVLEHDGVRLAVVDLSVLVTEAPCRVPWQAPAARVIVLARHAPLALLAERALGEATLEPSRIRWRSAQTRRFWLEGVSLEPPCALLDVAALSEAVKAICLA
jgi:hypothetical protein